MNKTQKPVLTGTGFLFVQTICAIILDVAPKFEKSNLEITAQKYHMSTAMALGLGAGVYFEYFRQPHDAPTRFISGLHRDLEKTLEMRVPHYQDDPLASLYEALRQNALWFNLDRAPTNGLLGMEMLAEELPNLQSLADRHECVMQMATTIQATGALYRQVYAEFLQDCDPLLPGTANLGCAMQEIAGEWHEFADQLTETAHDSSGLERAGRMLRRLALREEHFWGCVLELR